MSQNFKAEEGPAIIRIIISQALSDIYSATGVLKGKQLKIHRVVLCLTKFVNSELITFVSLTLDIRPTFTYQSCHKRSCFQFSCFTFQFKTLSSGYSRNVAPSA